MVISLVFRARVERKKETSLRYYWQGASACARIASMMNKGDKVKEFLLLSQLV